MTKRKSLFKLSVFFIMLIFLLTACSSTKTINPEDNQESLFTNEQLNTAAEINVSETYDIFGKDLNNLEINLEKEVEEAESELSSQAILPNVSGYLSYYRKSGGTYEIWIIDQSNEVKTKVLNTAYAVQSVAVSGDGLWLAASMINPNHGKYDIYLFDISTLSMLNLTNSANKDERDVSMTSDGSKVVYTKPTNAGLSKVNICHYDAFLQSCSVSILASSDSQIQPSITAEGSFIALVRLLSGGRWRVLLYDVLANTYTTVSTRPEELSHPSANYDGSQVMFLRDRTETTVGKHLVRIKNLKTNVVYNELSKPNVGHPHMLPTANYFTYRDDTINGTRAFTRNIATNQRASAQAGAWDYYQPYWQEKLKIAKLMQNTINFAPNELEQIVWFPLPAAATLKIDNVPGYTVKAYNKQGVPLADPSPQGDYLNLQLPSADEFYFLRVNRETAQSTTEAELELALLFSEPSSLFYDDAPTELFPEYSIFSPLKQFPSGNAFWEVPNGEPYETFQEYVQEVWGFDPELGLAFDDWLIVEELPEGLCPAAGAAGPLPPAGAQHDENYCGISVFIHSMETYFPGALKNNVRTNAASWDEVGDNLDHSCTFGIRGNKLVDNVNKNYGNATPKSQNGQAYCAGKISRANATATNLANWAEDCNVKLLVYDFSSFFGHWVDVNKVNIDPNDPNSGILELQDYQFAYSVNLTGPGFVGQATVDFSTANANSVMGKNFKGDNTLAGDSWYEPLGFTVVCKCNVVNGKYQLPTVNSAGKPLLQ